MKDEKKWYIEVPGHGKIAVSKEVYIAYRNDQSKERMKKVRECTCRVMGKSGRLITCPNKGHCSELECPHLNESSSTLSLDQLYEDYEYEVADDSESIVESLASQERAEQVNKAINELEPMDRKIIRLLFWEDMKQEEVAKVLHMSQSAVNQRKSKVLNTLKDKLIKFF